MKTTSNNDSKTRGKPFQPGNTFGKGRPAGSRNKATLVLEALIEGQGEEIINTIKFISPGFGGINLEDISAPRCFEIEARLKKS